MAVETLAGIKVPDRAQFIRVMLTEFFRLSNHLVWFSTFAQDMRGHHPDLLHLRGAGKDHGHRRADHRGAPAPGLVPAGGRGRGPAGGLEGAHGRFRQGVRRPGSRNRKRPLTQNPIFEARTRGVGYLSREEAMDWGVTGPNLRACGLEWDLRKKIPYSGYEAFDFEVPACRKGTATPGTWCGWRRCARACGSSSRRPVRCPRGATSPTTTAMSSPEKKDTLKDIESLIHHFINATRGPKMPRGEAYAATEHRPGGAGLLRGQRQP